MMLRRHLEPVFKMLVQEARSLQFFLATSFAVSLTLIVAAVLLKA